MRPRKTDQDRRASRARALPALLVLSSPLSGCVLTGADGFTAVNAHAIRCIDSDGQAFDLVAARSIQDTSCPHEPANRPMDCALLTTWVETFADCSPQGWPIQGGATDMFLNRVADVHDAPTSVVLSSCKDDGGELIGMFGESQLNVIAGRAWVSFDTHQSGGHFEGYDHSLRGTLDAAWCGEVSLGESQPSR